jgi:hypothetical protein
VTRGIIKDHATGRARRRRRERAARRHAYRPEKKRCGPTSHSEQYRMIRDPSGVSNFRIIFLIRTVPPPPTNPNPGVAVVIGLAVHCTKKAHKLKVVDAN